MKEWTIKLIFLTVACMVLSKFILSNIEIKHSGYVTLNSKINMDMTSDLKLKNDYAAFRIRHEQDGGFYIHQTVR